MNTVLVTGAAGFIGFHLSKRLLESNYNVIGIDNLNDYYDPQLKYGRLIELGIDYKLAKKNTLIGSKIFSNFKFQKTDIQDSDAINDLFKLYEFEYVVNLAAQAGVRYSLENPGAYISSNINGFFNILEASKTYKTKHLIYASSSSVYGMNKDVPFSVDQNVDHPVSLYAATKKSNELMAHTYSHLYDIKTTGLRFFTVYGPWGRPDMAMFLFTKAILEGKPINVFNDGQLQRDFTFIDDIIEGIMQVIKDGNLDKNQSNSIAEKMNTLSSLYQIYNIGNGAPVKLLDFIQAIEEELKVNAKINFMPMQPGDVYKTWADCSQLEKEFNYKPNTNIKAGVKEFIKWYRSYYNV